MSFFSWFFSSFIWIYNSNHANACNHFSTQFYYFCKLTNSPVTLQRRFNVLTANLVTQFLQRNWGEDFFLTLQIHLHVMLCVDTLMMNIYVHSNISNTNLFRKQDHSVSEREKICKNFPNNRQIGNVTSTSHFFFSLNGIERKFNCVFVIYECTSSCWVVRYYMDVQWFVSSLCKEIIMYTIATFIWKVDTMKPPIVPTF